MPIIPFLEKVYLHCGLVDSLQKTIVILGQCFCYVTTHLYFLQVIYVVRATNGRSIITMCSICLPIRPCAMLIRPLIYMSAHKLRDVDTLVAHIWL